MKKFTSLKDLLIEELADLLDSGAQLITALPKMAQACQSSTLKASLENYLKVTKDQANRLQDIFSNTEHNHPGRVCRALKSLIREYEELVNKGEKGPARDAAIISIVQRVARYEIDGYKTAREHAADLGFIKMLALVEETLKEERAMNFHLNELAQSMINVQAIDPKGTQQEDKPQERSLNNGAKGFYIPVSRFISEGNPNIQEPPEKGKEKDQ